MKAETDFPRIESHLPEVMKFTATLSQDLDSRRIDSWPLMYEVVRDFFTPEKLDEVDGIVPGWLQMSSYGDGVTLVHVMSALAALCLCPEYMSATENQQGLMKWIVLLHDIDKAVLDGKRDPGHAFRSASTAGRIIHRLGFGVTEQYESRANDWACLTRSATVGRGFDSIPDNSKLPDIVDGIEEIFGCATPSALLVKAILFHLSLNVVKQWPQAAAINASEMKKYISVDLLPLLKTMMLVDNDAWSLFDQSLRSAHRSETLLVYREIENMTL